MRAVPERDGTGPDTAGRPPVRPFRSDEGYSVVPLLGGDVLDRQRHAFADLALARDHAYFASPVHSTRADARRIHLDLVDAVAPTIRAVIGDLVPFLAGFISKGAGSGAPVGYHQDWTYCDERVGRSVMVWIPLVDVDHDNGAMRIVAGSHRWNDGIRPGPGLDHARDALERFDQLAETVEMGAGDALVYDPAVVHGSPPNRSDRVRPAIAMAFAPAHVPLVHFHRDDDGTVRGYAVDESYFTTMEFNATPDPPTPYELWTAPVTEELLSTAARGHGT